MSETLERAAELEKRAREIMAEAEAKVAALEAEMRKLKAEERKNAIDEIADRMISLAIPLEAVEKAFRKKAAKAKFDAAPPKKFPVKFRGPGEGQEWTGTGRKPQWLKDLEAKGHSPDEFLIETPK